MSRRPFHALTNCVDDLVDAHVGDGDMTLHFSGRNIPVTGTVRTEVGEQFVDGMVVPLNRFYLSVAERQIPLALSGGSQAYLTRKDPYNEDNLETFAVVAADRSRTGRVKIILSLHRGQIPNKIATRVPDARKNQATTPYR